MTGVAHTLTNFTSRVQERSNNFVWGVVNDFKDFPRKVAWGGYICWGWWTDTHPSSKLKLIYAPYNIGGSHFLTPDWFQQYDRTLGRFIWEHAYENYFSFIFKHLGVEHEFIKLDGMEYPVMISEHSSATKKSMYPLRTIQEIMALPKDCTYEDAIAFWSTYLNYQSRGVGHSDSAPLFTSEDEVGTFAPVARLFSQEFAGVLGENLRESADNQHGNHYGNSLRTYKQQFLPTGRFYTVETLNTSVRYEPTPIISQKDNPNITGEIINA